jgi:hypothetical protein
MLPSKRLLQWHLAKEAKRRAEEELNRLKEEKISREEKLETLQQALSADDAPPSPESSLPGSAVFQGISAHCRTSGAAGCRGAKPIVHGLLFASVAQQVE